jgi:phenylalanine-4-hydroxylase
MNLSDVQPLHRPEAQATWKKFFQEFLAHTCRFEAVLHPFYRENLGILEAFKDRIPTLGDIQALLTPHGWTAAYVEGYTAPWKIARLLAARTLPISRTIRPPHEVFFASEPDLIHDIVGHLPSLLSPGYRHLLERWARAAGHEPVSEVDRTHFHLNKLIVQTQDRVPARDFEHLQRAARAVGSFIEAQPSRTQIQDRIYFWIFEFGMVETSGKRQILGAGILSSLTELTKIATQPITTRRLTPESFMSSYNISSEQSEYLVVRHENDYLAFLDAVAPTPPVWQATPGAKLRERRSSYG